MLVARHTLTTHRPSKMPFKVGTVNFVNSLAPPFIEKYAPKVKTAKGLKAMLDKSQGS